MILLDVDGVLTNFVGSALRLFMSQEMVDLTLLNWPLGEWDVAKVLGVSASQFWEDIDEAGENWWASLPEYPWAQTLLRVVQDHDEFILATSPSLHQCSAAGKVRWMQKRFHEGFRAYMLGEHKHLMAGPGRILIDDSERQCERFESAGGRAILFPRPWNRLGAIKEPVPYIVEQLGAKQ